MAKTQRILPMHADRCLAQRNLSQVVDSLSHCRKQWRRQFGVAFLNRILLAIRVYPIQEIHERSVRAESDDRVRK